MFHGSLVVSSYYHSWRIRYNQYFDGKFNRRPPPKKLSGAKILEQFEVIENIQFEKTLSTRKRKRIEAELNWTKRSIFFKLPYWKQLLLHHNLDVMHIEKNIYDNIIGIICWKMCPKAYHLSGR